jgi:hypothetical protein
MKKSIARAVSYHHRDWSAFRRQGPWSWGREGRRPVPELGQCRMLNMEMTAAPSAEEATAMTTTLPDADLEWRLGTVGEAMTGEVVLLEADTLADVAVRHPERPGCRAPR